MNKARFIFDFDGTLAQYYWGEEYYKEGFVRNLPETAITEAVRLLVRAGAHVYVDSFTKHDAEEAEKRMWLSKHIPELREERMLFPRTGKSDKTAGLGKVTATDILVDDFSPNLLSWKGTGVKYYNSINGSHGTWRRSGGLYLRDNMSPEIMAAALIRLGAALSE